MDSLYGHRGTLPTLQERLDFLAEVTEHEAALLKIYGRLRPGNPPQVDKARDLFQEKFFDDNRYRLGRVGRFRINRKFEDDSVYSVCKEDVQHLRAEDFLAVIRYIMDLRAKRNRAHIDDIDHLGNRRLLAHLTQEAAAHCSRQ